MVTVLITGCGGSVGLNVAKTLKMDSTSFQIIGIDADPYAACFYMKKTVHLFQQTYLVPRADHLDYVPTLARICRNENVDVIFPCTDFELEKLSASKTEIAEEGIQIIISPLETIRICRDKWFTYRSLKKDLPIVKSALPDQGIEKALKICGLPAIIKPRLGWGSKAAYKVESVEEARVLASHIQKPIIQTFLESEEYTVDGLTNKHGEVICIVPRRRIKILKGISMQSVTVRDEKMIQLGKKITKCLEITGPFNFQVRKINGEPKVFEINPRFSGTGILSAKAGANIPLLTVRDICNMSIPADIDFNEGLTVSRYFEEVFFNIEEVAHADGHQKDI